MIKLSLWVSNYLFIYHDALYLSRSINSCNVILNLWYDFLGSRYVITIYLNAS